MKAHTSEESPRIRALTGIATLAFLSTVSLATSGCEWAATSGELIDRYTGAGCIAFGLKSDTGLRAWDYTLRLQNGETAHIFGAQVPPPFDARIQVDYGGGSVVTAAYAGYNIRPTDVRLDREHERLFVKAEGSAGGWRPETWLFAYDLRQRRENGRLLVDPGVMPPECAGGK